MEGKPAETRRAKPKQYDNDMIKIKKNHPPRAGQGEDKLSEREDNKDFPRNIKRIRKLYKNIQALLGTPW